MQVACSLFNNVCINKSLQWKRKTQTPEKKQATE